MSDHTEPLQAEDPTKDVEPRGGFLRHGRHPVNIGHLVMGVAFAGMVLVWALVAGDAVGGDDVRWLMPVPWVLAGAAGLVGLVASDRRRVGQQAYQVGQQQTGWVGTGTMER